MSLIAVYPGTFDPITNGHTDLVRRAQPLFDRVVVGVAGASGKPAFFSRDERIGMATRVLAQYAGVEVHGFDGLLVDFAREHSASVILRGLRAVSNFEYEFQLASMNRRLEPGLETVFLAPAEQYTFVSASLVKEIARHGGDVSAFVHSETLHALCEKFRQRG